MHQDVVPAALRRGRGHAVSGALVGQTTMRRIDGCRPSTAPQRHRPRRLTPTTVLRDPRRKFPPPYRHDQGPCRDRSGGEGSPRISASFGPLADDRLDGPPGGSIAASAKLENR